MKEMTITEHLEELRTTLIHITLILLGTFVLTYAFGGQISEVLLGPLRGALSKLGDNSGKIVYLGLLDKVLSQLQVAFWCAILFSSPLWFFKVWQFIKPGLHAHESKAVRPFILVGFLLFSLGVCFGYFLVFPFTFETLLNFGVGDIEASISLKEYLVLASKALVFLGLVFQLPNILLILGFMGVATKQSLRKQRKYVYVAFSFVAAMLTPPDVFTMLGLWLPLAILFEVGILLVAMIVHPYLARQHMES
jgi:sec-independent protein translocase protein TatC